MSSALTLFRQLLLGITLIVIAGGLLLFSDLNSRKGARERAEGLGQVRLPRIAVVQYTSHPVFDTGVEGMIDGLAEKGWVHKKTADIRMLNPFGDSNLANSIAREVVEGGYDLVLTATTPSTLSVANANRYRRIPHIFALVSDPVALNIGVKSLDTLDHPPYISGYGSRLPAWSAFTIAYQMNPKLKKIGTIWNVTEVNSEIQIHDARQFCKERGIELIEVNVDHSSGAAEATKALISRGIEALFVPGDVTVMSSIDNVMGVAHKAKIPAFTPFHTDVEKGALFGVGANYYEVGRQAGIMAAEVLAGRDPATIPVTDFVPEKIGLNEKVRRRLEKQKSWTFTPDLLERCVLYVDGNGVVENRENSKPANSKELEQ